MKNDSLSNPNALPRFVLLQIVISVIALIIFLGVIFQIAPLIEEKAKLEIQNEELRQELLDRKTELEGVKSQTVTAEERLQQIRAELIQAEEKLHNIYNPPLTSIKPQAMKSEIDEDITTRLGSKFYNFSLWLEIPGLLNEKIDEVEYFFDNPTFRTKNMVSRNPASGFAVSYVGFSCIVEVMITIRFKDQTSHHINFAFCEALAPSDMPT